MPVRSLNSSVIKWPPRREVEKSLIQLSNRLTRERDDVIRIGYFGSYAKGNWGVGSDLDVIIILEESDEPFERRGAHFDTSAIPVSTELLVYTREEWKKMKRQNVSFYGSVSDEIIWLDQKNHT